MSKGALLWPGERMRAFYRAHIAKSGRVPSDEVDRIVDDLAGATNRMLVWSMPETTDAAASAPLKRRLRRGSNDLPDATADTDAAFDPYAFSAMVVLTRSGADGLRQKLAAITTLGDLKSFAEAQHLAVDDRIKSPQKLREALVAAAEQRMADRKAAAS